MTEAWHSMELRLSEWIRLIVEEWEKEQGAETLWAAVRLEEHLEEAAERLEDEPSPVVELTVRLVQDRVFNGAHDHVVGAGMLTLATGLLDGGVLAELYAIAEATLK